MMNRFVSLVFLCELLPLLPAAEPALAPAPAEPAQAPTSDDLDDLFSLRVGLYRQQDRGGNQHVDERASVYESIVFIRTAVAEHHDVEIRLLGDVISAASYDRFKDQAIASGATGYNPGHLQGGLGWRYHRTDWDVGLEGTYGQEFAYRTVSLAGSAHQAFANRNTQLGLTARYFNDQVRVIHFDGTHDPDVHRRTGSVDVQWTQIVTRDVVVNLDLAHTRQVGYLATSFNAVFVNGVEEEERAPSQRLRYAATLSGKQAIDHEQSWQVDYRLYHDTWGIDAHTIGLHYFRYLANDRVLIEPHYRFCDQSAADFYRDDFGVSQRHQTSDSDLGRFTGHELGLTTTVFTPTLFGTHSSLSLALTGYRRDDGLDLYWLVLGLDAGF